MATTESVKAKIQNLITKANDTTNLADKDLTNAVNHLVEGYGQGGSGGSCSGNHIIEVDTLPTENIDENALYKCGDSYCRYIKALKNIYAVAYGQRIFLVDIYISQGFTVELYYVSTKPTTAIKEYSETTMLAPVYYVEDEDDCFVYTSGMWVSISTQIQIPNGGAISDISEASENYYHALVECGWKPLGAAEYDGSVVIE